MYNEFTAIIEKDGDWYIAYCLEIPGANGQGKTIEECKASLAEAISLILEDRREDAMRGLPEVIYEVKNSGRNRTEAINLVAQRRNKAPQTVIDKYCRQLGKRAYEIDWLLEDQNLGEQRAVLEGKFVRHRKLIDTFFASLKNGKDKEVHHV